MLGFVQAPHPRLPALRALPVPRPRWIGWLGAGCAALLLADTTRAEPEWAEWLVDTEMSGRFDDNANRASASSEQEWDLAFTPRLAGGRAAQLAKYTRLLALLEVGAAIYSREEDLTSIAGGGRLVLLHKFGLGDAPWASLSAAGGYEAVRADQRSGPRYSAGAALGKRFSPRFDARAEYRFSTRFGRDGPRVAPAPGVADDVFDQRAHEIGVEGRFLLTQRLALSGGFDYRRGDFDSNAQDSRFDVLQRRDVEAVALDEAFGGWVYRLEGNAYSPFLRLDLGLSARWSAGLAYRYQYGESGGLDYQNHRAEATVLFRY